MPHIMRRYVALRDRTLWIVLGAVALIGVIVGVIVGWLYV